MFVPCVLRRRVVDENVSVRRNCKPDMDLEPGTVTVLVTRCDHSYAASDDAMIVFLQPGSQRISNCAAVAKRRINRTVGRGRNPCS